MTDGATLVATRLDQLLDEMDPVVASNAARS